MTNVYQNQLIWYHRCIYSNWHLNMCTLRHVLIAIRLKDILLHTRCSFVFEKWQNKDGLIHTAVLHKIKFNKHLLLKIIQNCTYTEVESILYIHWGRINTFGTLRWFYFCYLQEGILHHYNGQLPFNMMEKK